MLRDDVLARLPLFLFATSVCLVFCGLSTDSLNNIAKADVSGKDATTARALFDEARKLMAKGEFAVACPKLEEGLRLNPGVGMKYNLADCYEQLGRTASAWSLFLDTAAAAKDSKSTAKEKDARKRAAKLEPDLSKLTIKLADGLNKLEALAIKRSSNIAPDDILVGPGQWGVALPVDPGTYVVKVTATGYKDWQIERVVRSATETTVLVPNLEPLPKPEVTLIPEPVKVLDHSNNFATPMWIAVGVGGGAALIGGIFALRATSLNSDSSALCDGNRCNDEGFDVRTRARSAGNIATVSFVVSGLSFGTALTLALWPSAASKTVEKTSVDGPKPKESGLRVTPLFGPFQGILLSGAF